MQSRNLLFPFTRTLKVPGIDEDRTTGRDLAERGGDTCIEHHRGHLYLRVRSKVSAVGRGDRETVADPLIGHGDDVANPAGQVVAARGSAVIGTLCAARWEAMTQDSAGVSIT